MAKLCKMRGWFSYSFVVRIKYSNELAACEYLFYWNNSSVSFRSY